MSPELYKHLGPRVTIRPYGEIESFLQQLTQRGGKVLVDPSRVNLRLYRTLGTVLQFYYMTRQAVTERSLRGDLFCLLSASIIIPPNE